MIDPFICVPVKVLQAKLPPGALSVLLGLLSFRNRENGLCNPDVNTLCDQLGASRRTVFRWLHELTQAGILEIERNIGYSNSYVFHKSVIHTVENSAEKPQNAKGGSAKSGTGGCAKSGTGGCAKSGTKQRAHPYMNQMLFEPEGNRAVPPTVVEVRGAAAAAVGCVENSPERPASPVEAEAPEQLGLPLEPVAQPLAHPVSLPDSAEALARELSSTHPQPGLPRKAIGEVHKALAAGWTPDAIRERHAEWRAYWATVPAGKFIPQLWRWFDSGDFEVKPAIRKPPAVESYVERFRRQLREA
jgi:hypothetical protein